MYKKLNNKEYSKNSFRAVNFKIYDEGKIKFPNGKAFESPYGRALRENQYGKKEEIYICEDYKECSYAEKCKKTIKNGTIPVNEKPTSMHKKDQ